MVQERRAPLCDNERVDTHAVRIGREMHDLWIDVMVEDGSTSAETGRWRAFRKPVSPEQRAEKLRSVREGLVLLSAMARVDYASWVGGMVRNAYFPVPNHLDLLHCPEIAREFCFSLSAHLGPEYYQWELLQHIMGDDNLSEAFAQDMDKIVEIAKQTSCDVGLFDVIPIKLAIQPEGTDGEELERELQILRGVIETVRELHAINDRNRTATATRTRPYFRFDGVELKLRSFMMHPHVFRLIRELLETGVHVKMLTLPSRPRRHRGISDTELRAAWSGLMATALGHRGLDARRAVQLDQLKLDGVYMTENFMASLCSALRDTRVLQHLSIQGGEFDELDVASQRRIWKWLDYALFSSPPTNSVQTVEIEFLKLRSTAHGGLATGTESNDPVGDLWCVMTSAQDHSGLLSGDRPIVSITAGTTITTYDQSLSFETTVMHVGKLICDQADKPTMDVLMPGFGFSQVPREHVTLCDPTSSTDSFVGEPITTLKVHFKDNFHRDGQNEALVTLLRTFYERLLEFVGPSLTALVEGFEQFLAVLTPEDGVHPIQQALRRLRVGRGYSGVFRSATRHAIENALFSNKTLTHFLMFQKARTARRGGWFGGADSDEDDDDGPDWSVSTYFNGELLPIYPLQARRRIAFLSALHHLRDQNRAGAQIGADLIQVIFSFAADRVWRRALTLRDVDSELVEFMRDRGLDDFEDE